MRYRLLAGVLLVCFILSGAHQVAWAQSATSDKFYYHGEQRIALQLSTRFVAVRLQEGVRFQPSTSVSAQLAGEKAQKLSLNRLNLYRLQDETADKQVDSLRMELSTAPGVSFVAPVFQARETLMIVTDEFIAQFAANVSRDVIDRINAGNGVEVVSKMDWSPNCYLLRVVQGDCLETANSYHQMGDVLYAHPNFVRVRDKLRSAAGGNRPPVSFVERQLSLPLKAVAPASDDDVQPSSSSLVAGNPDNIDFDPVLRTKIDFIDFEAPPYHSGWTLSGVPGDTIWGRVSAAQGGRAYSGGGSGYCAGGGTAAVDPPGPYLADRITKMRSDPGLIDLTNAQDARLVFRIWADIEEGPDEFTVLVYDGPIGKGTLISGDWAGWVGGSGFMTWAVDFKNTGHLDGDMRGKSDIEVEFVFESDGAINYEGVYLDDIVIEKITGGYLNLTSDIYDHLQWSLRNNGQLWGLKGADIGAKEAWSLSEGKGTVIAIVDDGVDLSHPDLNLVGGYDATLGGSAGGPSGDDAHGTGCAGIAAAITDNGKGIAGVAGKASVMPIRVAYGDPGNWVSTDAWIADGLTWAVDNGADVLSNSWGGGSPATVIDNALSYARTHGRDGKGCLVVFSTGNGNGDVLYPATSSDVMAVGALSPCDERTNPNSCDGEFWWGSNFGPQLDITAPGVHMYTTDIQGAAGYSLGDYYYDFNGTSSAAPVVAGVGGLLLGMCPDLDVTDVEDILTRTAVDLQTAGWDQYTGYGRVNAYEALMYAREKNCLRSSWSMYLAAITANTMASSTLPQWGAGSEVCCETSSVTFTLSNSGVSKSSSVADCSKAGTWQGWEVGTSGTQTFSWTLTSANCGSYSGSFNYSLAAGKSYLFQIELDDSNSLAVMAYINTLSSAVQKESLADGSKSAAGGEVQAGRKLVGTIPLNIPKGAFGKSSCKITE